MEKRKIGSLEVSVVGLGCNNFGWRIDAPATARVVDAALDAGINFLDTADIYAYGPERGVSRPGAERPLEPRRDRHQVRQQVGRTAPGRARPDYVRRAVEDSLRRLGTDRIDLYQLTIRTRTRRSPIPWKRSMGW